LNYSSEDIGQMYVLITCSSGYYFNFEELNLLWWRGTSCRTTQTPCTVSV